MTEYVAYEYHRCAIRLRIELDETQYPQTMSDDIIEPLNELGSHGWEVISIKYQVHRDGNITAGYPVAEVFLKRPYIRTIEI